MRVSAFPRSLLEFSVLPLCLCASVVIVGHIIAVVVAATVAATLAVAADQGSDLLAQIGRAPNTRPGLCPTTKQNTRYHPER